jgi:hypothetical protein
MSQIYLHLNKSRGSRPKAAVGAEHKNPETLVVKDQRVLRRIGLVWKRLQVSGLGRLRRDAEEFVPRESASTSDAMNDYCDSLVVQADR